jgi:hypothetical protein
MYQELERDEYNEVWDRFEEQFKFNPSVKSSKWPGIIEPKPSFTITWRNRDIGSLDFDSLEVCFLKAFNQLPDQSSIVYALDWQHTSYRIDVRQSEKDRPLWVFPDGDYYIWLSKDFGTGTFGHPWEQTICIFGEELIKIIRDSLPSSFSTIIRENT